MIDNLAVSGEHAVLQMVGADVFIEDLNSTNGTYINGKAIKKQLLSHNDTVEIGKYKIKYLVEDGTDYEKTMIMKPGQPPHAAAGAQAYQPTQGWRPRLRLDSGAGGGPARGLDQGAQRRGAGREVMLTKVVTTVGKPGVQVASITKRPGGYVSPMSRRPPDRQRIPVTSDRAAQERRRRRAGRHAMQFVQARSCFCATPCAHESGALRLLRWALLGGAPSPSA